MAADANEPPQPAILLGRHAASVRVAGDTSGAQPHIHNEDVALAFEEMAELLAISGENPFRVRACQRGAQVVRTLPRALQDFRTAKELDALPGIGPDLAHKIQEMLRTGSIAALEQLRRQVPTGLRELLRLPGLGPIRVHALHARLGICDVASLQSALASGRLAEMKGFGPVMQNRLRAALAMHEAAIQRRPWSVACRYAEPLRDHLAAAPGIREVAIAGSYRRGRDTVADIDLVASGGARADLPAALRDCPEIQELTLAGKTRCTAILRGGLQVDVRLVPPESFGAALLYLTGSRDHNIALRRMARERGLKLSEYGLFRGAESCAGRTETQVYAALGLPLIPPELRENRGEISAAARGELPKLVGLCDLKGDLHVHTNATDGREPLQAMVKAARARGLSYIAITDHSRHLGIVRGLDAGRLARQIDEIDALNARLDDFVVLKGVEVDILEDGRLALPDSVLCRLDVVVAAIHTQFKLPEAKQTRRVLRALDNPCVSILAHPTGRLIGERPPCALDLARVVQAAAERSCFLELNSQPLRLDMDDVLCKSAREAGVLISISSDAHSGAELAQLEYGVRQARRGWLTATDVLNAKPLADVKTLLAKSRS